MAFINDYDYRVVIGETALKVISQVSEEVRAAAEAQAQAEIAGYLNPKFDTEKIFGSNDARQPLIVMYTCDIALYHMSASLPGKMGTEIRKERYERAIKWLEGVANGKIVPTGLPLATVITSTGERPIGSTRYSSDKKQRNIW
ncbi:MAG: DUF1320 family protein [Muribaculaceae bacterium]|nr:DUF1320 family protein [Muribaculaceae bacterium]